MILAVMNNDVRGVFYLIAIILFAIAAVLPVPKVNLMALGLALFVIPFCYDAFSV
jgi:hypothetical protein